MEMEKKGFGAFFFAELVGKLVLVLKKWLGENFLKRSLEFFQIIGNWGLLIAAPIGFILAMIVAIRGNSLMHFLYGLGWILLVFVVQYVARRFATAGENLIATTPTRMASTTFLDCFGFLAVIVALLAFVVSGIVAVQASRVEIFLIAIGFLVLAIYFAAVAFQPITVNVHIVEETTAGQEAIGILAFFLKGALKLIPIVFGIGIIVGLVLIVVKGIGIFGENWKMALAWQETLQWAGNLLCAALTPLIAFLFFILNYLVLEVIQAILILPEKIAAIGKR